MTIKQYQAGTAQDGSVIAALYQYFSECPLLSGGKIHVDFLPDEATQYSIDVVPGRSVIKRYITGAEQRQYLFMIASREFYGPQTAQNLSNSGFYETLARWTETQNKNGRLPLLPAGSQAQRLEVLTNGYAFDTDTDNARYQIQIRLIYYQEA